MTDDLVERLLEARVSEYDDSVPMWVATGLEHEAAARIRALEEALKPFADAFGEQDWHRRRHDLNALSEMLSLPRPITPDDISRLCAALAQKEPT